MSAVACGQFRHIIIWVRISSLGYYRALQGAYREPNIQRRKDAKRKKAYRPASVRPTRSRDVRWHVMFLRTCVQAALSAIRSGSGGLQCHRPR